MLIQYSEYTYSTNVVLLHYYTTLQLLSTGPSSLTLLLSDRLLVPSSAPSSALWSYVPPKTLAVFHIVPYSLTHLSLHSVYDTVTFIGNGQTRTLTLRWTFINVVCVMSMRPHCIVVYGVRRRERRMFTRIEGILLSAIQWVMMINHWESEHHHNTASPLCSALCPWWGTISNTARETHSNEIVDNNVQRHRI